MELVSVNTKNFLFLTLSQFNDTDESQRARVSMRRDSPFWMGGNSFIAAESFRVSAAPNEGGLYYKKITDSFFMGGTYSEKPEDDEKWDGVGLEMNFGKINDAIEDGPDHLICASISVSKIDDYETASGAFKISTLVPRDCRPFTTLRRMGRYFNIETLTKDTFVRLEKDANYIQGRLLIAPAAQVVGIGAGPSQLFTPLVTFLTGKTAYEQLRDSWNTAGNTVGTAIPVSLFFWNEDQELSNSEEFFKNVRALIAKGCYLQCSANDPDGNTKGNGASFMVLGPQSIKFINDSSGESGALDANNQLQRPITWDENTDLDVGVQVKVGRDNGTNKPSTTDSWWTNPMLTHTAEKVSQIGRHWIKTDRETIDAGVRFGVKVNVMIYAFKQAIQIAGDDVNSQLVTEANYSESKFIGTNFFNNPNGGMFGLMKMKIASKSALPLGSSADKITLKMESGAEVTVRRSAENQIVYTPNEFFYIFNRPDDNGNALPWRLNTDVNGGFTVEWNSTNFHSFNISKAMCDSIGLNGFMWHETSTGKNVDETDAFWVLCSTRIDNQGDYGFHSFTENQVTLSANLLYLDKELTIPIAKPVLQVNNADPNLAPTTPQIPAFGTIVYDIHGNTLSVNRVIKTTRNTVASNRAKIFPQTQTDSTGNIFYHYQDLPSSAWIGNDAQISVESWSTFSEIILVVPNLPFQAMLGTQTDNRILCSLRIPFEYGTANGGDGNVTSTEFPYYGDLLFNSDSSRSYLKVTTNQELFDLDIEARLIRRDGSMEVMSIPKDGQFQVKVRLLQTQ